MKKLLFLLLVGALLAVQPCEAKKKVVRKKAKTTKVVKKEVKPDAKVTCPPENVEGEIRSLAGDVASDNSSTEMVYKDVDQMPQFPGGDGALLKAVAAHLQYPESAAKQGVEGKVIIQFVVTKTGSVGETKVIQSLNPECDRAAQKAVKSLPHFTPGRLNGQAVNVWYTLPMTFKLQK